METVFRNLVPRDVFYKEAGRAMPWDNEPDAVLGLYRGFPHATLRHHGLGHLCGYAAVSEKHHWYNKPYAELPNRLEGKDGTTLYSVHGMFTYTASDLLVHGLATVTVPDTKVWWVGIDMAHHGDDTPCISFSAFRSEDLRNYRTVGYVYEQLVNIIRMASEEGEGVGIMPEMELTPDETLN